MSQLYLLDAVRAGFGSDTVRNASAFLGDPELSVRKSLDAIIPVTLAAMVNRAETGGAESLMALARDAREDRFENVAGHFAAGSDGFPAGASNLVQGLFGDRYGAVANAVTSFTGSRGSTISALFGSVVAYALALLGRHIERNNLSPDDVSSLLAGQKSSIWAAVPTGLNLASLLAPPSRPAPSYVAAGAAPTERGNPWLLPVLLLLIAGGVAWWLMRSRTAEPVVSAGLDTAPRTAMDTSAGSAGPVRDAAIKVTLPNGVVLDALRGGIEDRLVTFLQDPASRPGEDAWFDFNDLNFETGTARILPESREQITNLVQILKAFPAARIKVGGYTDSTGNEPANRKLSQDRAEAVARELRDAGVGGQVVDAEGYGSAFAKQPATASEQDRMTDRRVAVSVRDK
jgi:outer membrane protein OmpA-like peptidoglycan-associated protein